MIKGSRPEMHLFLIGYQTRKQMWDDCQFQILAIAIFLKIIGAHVNVLFIVKVNIFDDIKWTKILILYSLFMSIK